MRADRQKWKGASKYASKREPYLCLGKIMCNITPDDCQPSHQSCRQPDLLHRVARQELVNVIGKPVAGTDEFRRQAENHRKKKRREMGTRPLLKDTGGRGVQPGWLEKAAGWASQGWKGRRFSLLSPVEPACDSLGWTQLYSCSIRGG